MSAKIHNPHDKLFRHLMADIRVAREFLMAHVPKSVLQQVDLDLLTLVSESFVDQELKLSMADVLYRAELKHSSNAIYFLVEHQSAIHELMPLRMLKYQVAIIDFHLKQYNTSILPVVYAVVFYHGRKPYTKSIDIMDYFGEQKTLAKEIIYQPFQLVDVNKIADEELYQYLWSGTMEFVFKHIYAQDILEPMQRIIPQLARLDNENGDSILQVLINYILQQADAQDINKLISVLSSALSAKTGENIMTGAEQLRAQGFEKGMQQGMQQERRLVAEAMLRKGMAPLMVSELTSLTLEAVQQLLEKVLSTT